MLIDTGIDEHIKSISAFNCVSLSIEEQIKLKTTFEQLKCNINVIYLKDYQVMNQEKQIIIFILEKQKVKIKEI